MGRKRFWLFPVIVMFSLLLTQCGKNKVNSYNNTLQADQIIENGGLNNPNSRDQAQSLYADALNNLSKGDIHYGLIYTHANFGLGMIGVWSALDTASGLLSSGFLGSLGGSSTTSTCQPIDLTPYQTLLIPVLDGMLSPIVSHFQAVSQFTGYTFTFTINNGDLVVLSDMGMLSSSLAGQSFSIDMSGDYDLGEVDGMLSMFETLQGGVKLLFAYNGVANALINLVVGLVQTGCTSQNPLSDPTFGTLSSNGAQMISDAQFLFADASQNMSNAMSVIMARKGDNSGHGFINYVDNDSNGKYDPPTSTTTGDTWGSEVAGQLIYVVFKLLPALSPSLMSSLPPSLGSVISGITALPQKQAAQAISNLLFVQGLGSLSLGGMTISVPALSRLIYLTDLQSVSNVLHASVTDTDGQHPIDIIPAIPVLLPRLMPVLDPLLASLGTSGTLGSLVGMLPTLEAVMFDSTGDAYISLPVIPSIDLGAFLGNPPGDLKAFAPLSYQQSDPLVGTSTYTAPENFADGFVHVPASEDPNGAGYWTSTASFVPGMDGSASGPGNVISGTVNGTCDAVNTFTDPTAGGAPTAYTISGLCSGDPTSTSYSGEWYQDSGDHVWHANVQVCNSAQSNQPCFVDLYGDGVYHQAGDIIEQADEEQAFPLQTQPFTGPAWNGVTLSAYSDTGTNRTPDNFELGYNSATNQDPYGDDLNCNTLIPAGLIALPWPLPSTPPEIGEAVCGEKNGMPDMWDNSLFSLIYLGAYVSLAGYPPNLGAVVAVGPLIDPTSTPFFPRYHYWPSSTFVDPPKLITLSLTGSTYYSLINSIEPGIFTAGNFAPNTLDSIAIALPNDAYMFFPDPTFGGLLTVGQFNWCSKYQNYIGIPYNASAPCDAISYSTANMTNAQFNQYTNLVNIVMGVLNGTVVLNLSGL